MKEKQTSLKKPINHKLIFKIMFWVTLIASSGFFVKNVISVNIPGMIAIGGCLGAFLLSVFIMYKKQVSDLTKEFIVSIILVFVVFIISLFSGASYSDDFPLYLALIGMVGMYLEPKFTKVQIVVIDIALVLMAVIHPEKAGEISQYILCFIVFNLAAILFYLAVCRGRAFIDVSIVRAEESEELIGTMRKMGAVLQKDFDASSASIDESTHELQKGSEYIIGKAGDVFSSCDEVHGKIQLTEMQIQGLNAQVKNFEEALSENQSNIDAMKEQVKAVSDIIVQADTIFHEMQKKMREVTEFTAELEDISSRTTLLSLNASIEASRAGNEGAGFAVVAAEMKTLSENSETFSKQVTEVIEALSSQVEMTARQFAESTHAIEASETKMAELQSSFGYLKEQFGCLYDNIDEQNENVSQIDGLFAKLQRRVEKMRSSSEENKVAVSHIVDVMDDYRVNISKVIENTRV